MHQWRLQPLRVARIDIKPHVARARSPGRQSAKVRPGEREEITSKCVVLYAKPLRPWTVPILRTSGYDRVSGVMG